jgi:hypothetical protein
VELLRALGLPRASLVLGIAVATGVFFYMGTEGHRGEVVGGIFFESLLILFAQQGLDRRERFLFAGSAVVLGLLAFAAGSATGSLL